MEQESQADSGIERFWRDARVQFDQLRAAARQPLPWERHLTLNHDWGRLPPARHTMKRSTIHATRLVTVIAAAMFAGGAVAQSAPSSAPAPSTGTPSQSIPSVRGTSTPSTVPDSSQSPDSTPSTPAPSTYPKST